MNKNQSLKGILLLPNQIFNKKFLLKTLTFTFILFNVFHSYASELKLNNSERSGSELDNHHHYSLTSKIITGNVVSESGTPLLGVTIKIKGIELATATDANGNFSIDVSENAVLLVSYIGYETQEIPVLNRQHINIKLKQQNRQLDQVVVVGYGVQKKKDLTGSLSTINAKELENRPNTQFGYSIEGKAAGVQIIRSSGQPQAGFSIRVRGTSSITSDSDPIYVVDGVPTYNVNEINPADIESITVLKDASAAAIYGSSGANGVVLITTKRGKNQKLKLSFNTSVTMSAVWKKMDVLNASQFKDLATELGETTDWNLYNANTNWQDQIFRNAITQNYQLSATGGNKKTSYYLSGSAINQNGIVLNNSLKRLTLKTNIDHQISKMFTVGTSISYDNWKDVDVSENDRNGVITRLFTTIPNIGIRDPQHPEQYARSPFINDLENPVSTVYQPEHLFKNNRLHGNVYLEASLLKGLKFKSLLGFENAEGIYTSFQDSVQTRYGQSLGGLAAKNTYNYKYWVSENTLNYNTKINNHHFELLAGVIASRETNNNLYKSSHDFAGAPNTNVESGNIKSPDIPDYARKSHVAVIGRVNYNYKEKYYLTSNFRADASGQFTPSHRWGYFPSFSGGWRISQEDFFKNVKGINELKVRAGWGVVGNDRSRPYAWYGLIDTMQAYLFGGSTRTAFINTTLENSDLKWERTSQVDLGLDLSLLNNKLNFTVDYYSKITKDLLIEIPIPGSVGIPGNTALQNAGSIENKGFEFQVSSKNITKSNFKWNTDFNIYFNNSKVINIVGTTLYTGAINPSGNSVNISLVQAGLPLGSFYGFVSEGVDPTTGLIKYKDLDNNGIIDGNDQTVIGNANPKYTFGVTNSLSYKNFSLDVFFQGVQGNDVFNATRILTESMALPMNQSAKVLKRWRNPGDITNIPGVSPYNWDNSAVSSRYIEDGSYVRLKALTIGYSLPKKKIEKLKMSRCMLYFTAENLLTFTHYSGFDPEVSMFSGSGKGATNQNTSPGVDYGTYPQSRDFIIGANISF
ncbi:MAG: TonB-dependent receptor [Bacteroidota bacterium]